VKTDGVRFDERALRAGFVPDAQRSDDWQAIAS
jgi:hypothetical protein